MLQLKSLSLSYGAKTVVRNVSLELKAGQIGCLLGPSGCGKTTILRAIAGFETVQEGQIYLRGQLVSDKQLNLAPEKRHVAVVFQDFALFPHLSVAQNIEFGLHGVSKMQKKCRVEELLKLIGLSGIEERYSYSLSGGQQQRVALARALAPKPELLLLDEPFSSLDAELREELAADISAILKHEGATALMVTHDQHEAFSMADKIGVLNDGELLQWATAYELYHQPSCHFVADFVGNGVFLQGQITEQQGVQTSLGIFPLAAPLEWRAGQQVDLLVRPDDIVHDDESERTAKVIGKAFKGAHILYELELSHAGKEKILCLAPSHHDHKIGEIIGIRLDLEHLVLFNRAERVTI
ncbi:MAG: iron(III) transport system ATP-binding protein [Paraglaciecola sp.]|jgi:iron(III) transport system ATP-binding protein